MTSQAPHSKPPEPRVSIVLPCRNEEDYIEKCLRSVLRQEAVEGGIEILVADGRSNDRTRFLVESIAAADPRVRLIDNPQQIVSSGLNAAIRAAKGDIIIRMDAHTEYASDYVAQCVTTLEHTGADNVGGPWVAKGEGTISGAIAAAFQSPFAVGGARGHDPNHEGPVDTVYLGCWRRSAFDKFGYFDEDLVRNQDDEHNLRISRGGGKVFQSPKIRSIYRPRSSLAGLFRQYLQYGYWKVRVIQKHRIPASWRHLVPVTFLLALISLGLLSVPYLLSQLGMLSLPGAWGRIVGGPLAPLLLLGVTGSYALAIVLASIHTASRSHWNLLPALPWIFPCYHVGYGYGFLLGLWDFMVLRKAPGNWATKLTRVSKPPAS